MDLKTHAVVRRCWMLLDHFGVENNFGCEMHATIVDLDRLNRTSAFWTA